MNKVEIFISVIRDSFVGSQEVYTNGSCYHFYLILKEVYPQAECWYDTFHILTKIDDKFYDITGEVCAIGDNNNLHQLIEPIIYNLKAPYNIYKIKQ